MHRCALPSLLLFALLTGCERAPDEPAAAAAPQILRKGNGAEPETLDPATAEGVQSSHIQRDLFEGLVAEAEDGSLVPGVAERWTVSDDGLVYTFHLRPAARWSNGEAVTAHDFEFSLKRVVDPATGSEYSDNLAPIENAEAIIAGDMPAAALGVRALDAHTLEIRLRGPTPYFLGLLANSSAYAVHRPSLERYGAEFTRPGKLVSNGAYRLAEWVPHSHIRLVRNPHYWDAARVRIDEVWYYPIEDQSAELKRYRAGELDFTYTLPAGQFAWLREHFPDELVVAPWLGSFYLGLNTTRPPFDDERVRRALALAVDRETLTARVMGTGELPAYGFVPPVSDYTGQRPEWADWPHARRIAEARRLLAAAGYGPARPLRFELLVNTHETYQRICLAVAAMWQEALGVEATVVNQEWKVYLETRKNRRATQAFRAGWVGDYNDPHAFLELFQSHHRLNDTGFADARYDALLAQAGREGDPARRRALLEEAERVLLGVQPIIPLYFYVTKRLIKPYVKGWQSNIMDHHYTKYWYLEARGSRP